MVPPLKYLGHTGESLGGTLSNVLAGNEEYNITSGE